MIIFLDSFHSHPDLGTRQPPPHLVASTGTRPPHARPGVQHETRTQKHDTRRDLGDRAHPCSAFPRLPRQPLPCVLTVLTGGCMGAFLQPLFPGRRPVPLTLCVSGTLCAYLFTLFILRHIHAGPVVIPLVCRQALRLESLKCLCETPPKPSR